MSHFQLLMISEITGNSPVFVAMIAFRQLAKIKPYISKMIPGVPFKACALFRRGHPANGRDSNG